MSLVLARWTVLVALLGALLPGTALAQFSLGGATGLSMCVPDGDADCDEIYPSSFLEASLEYRFFGYVGLGLDYDFTGLTPEDHAVQIRAHHLIPMLRAHIPIVGTPLSVAVGGGLGFGELGAWHEEQEDAFYSFFTLWSVVKTQVTVWTELGGGLAAGGGLNLFWHFQGERCLVHHLGQQNCAPIEELRGADRDVSDLMHLSGNVRYSF